MLARSRVYSYHCYYGQRFFFKKKNYDLIKIGDLICHPEPIGKYLPEPILSEHEGILLINDRTRLYGNTLFTIYHSDWNSPLLRLERNQCYLNPHLEEFQIACLNHGLVDQGDPLFTLHTNPIIPYAITYINNNLYFTTEYLPHFHLNGDVSPPFRSVIIPSPYRGKITWTNPYPKPNSDEPLFHIDLLD